MLILPRKQISNGQLPSPNLPNTESDPVTVARVRAQGLANGLINPSDISNSDDRGWSGSIENELVGAGHMPHSICEGSGDRRHNSFTNMF
jgi:hypothetical protein